VARLEGASLNICNNPFERLRLNLLNISQVAGKLFNSKHHEIADGDNEASAKDMHEDLLFFVEQTKPRPVLRPAAAVESTRGMLAIRGTL